MPPTVVHVLQNLEVGGLERVVLALAGTTGRYLRRVLALGGGPLLEPMRAVCEVDVVPWSGGLAPSLWWRLALRFLAGRPAVVHTHGAAALIYAAPAARLAGVRAVVHTEHTRRAPGPERRTRLTRLAARWSHALVAVSADSAAAAIERGLPADRWQVIPNGVEVERYRLPPAARERARAELRVPTRAPTAGVVARLSVEKDHVTLLQAFAHCAPETHLVVVGDGPERADLEARALALGVAGRVRFTGLRDDVPELLAALDLFVLPSRVEGLPLAVVEAMAAGLPVVATRVGGTPEVVADGETGRLVAPGDAPMLAQAMSGLLADPGRAAALGAAGRRRAAAEFSLATAAAAYESLYDRLLGEPAIRRPPATCGPPGRTAAGG